MSNVIDAVINLVTDPKLDLRKYSAGNNRANDMGRGLEEYIKDLFAGTVGETDPEKRKSRLKKAFSYLGEDTNHPPDAMLKGGDAVEVKKTESYSIVQLNSSYPKAKVRIEDNMIAQKCREAIKKESGTERDIIYAVGVVPKNSGGRLSALAMVYGEDYCMSNSFYDKIRKPIEKKVKEAEEEIRKTVPGFELNDECNELGRANDIDLLKITNLRIRNMWEIDSPFKAYKEIFKRNRKKDFTFMCIINEDKWKTFKNVKALEGLANPNSPRKIDGFSIEDREIRCPDDPTSLRKVKLITFVK